MGRNRYLREEYLSRINRVIDYIESNMEDELFGRLFNLWQLPVDENLSSMFYY